MTDASLPAAAATPEPIPQTKADYLPILLVPGLAVLALALMLWLRVPLSSWITLTIAALAMGMMMVSPLTISLPFKLFLFVMIDGWSRLILGLVKTYM